MLKVIIVDDHKVVRAGYKFLLESTGNIKVVAEANSGEEVCQKYSIYKPDVIIMDLSMSGIGGLEAIRRLISKDANTKILVFSVHENAVFLHRALDAGAKGYITKRSASEIMIDAVCQVAKGKMFVGQDMLPYMVKPNENYNPFNKLSKREFEICLLLTKDKSAHEIAEIINLSTKTVSNHITSIKNKLKVSSLTELMRLSIRYGLAEI
jgi:two-component system invasion response regulator UvrY